MPQQTVRYDSQSGKPTAETLRYLALKEFYHQANESLQKLKDSLQEPALQRPVAIPTFKQVSWGYQWYRTRNLFISLLAAEDIRAFLEEALVTESLSESNLLAWRAERAVQRFQHAVRVQNEEAGNTLVIRSFGSPLRWRELEEGQREQGQSPPADFAAMIAGSLSLFLADSLELEVELTKEESNQYVFRLEGLLSGAAVSMVSGTLLWMREGGGLELIDVRSQTGGDVPSEIRYLAHEAGPMIDLQTGVATMRLSAMSAGQDNLTSALVDFWERIQREL